MRIDCEIDNIKKQMGNFFWEIDPRIFDFKKNSFNFLGKAIRSRFSLLFSRAVGLELRKAERLAVYSELAHTASLLHDDCIDGSSLRRGMSSINAKFGINTAILLGDLIMGRVFQEVSSFSQDIAISLANTVTKMAEGALKEENSRYKIIGLDEYKKNVSLKTSSLFRWIALSISHLSGKKLFEESARISEAFGLSFQIVDDVLDIEEGVSSGKESLKDITEGKLTMPFILAMENKEIAESIEKEFNEMKKSEIADISGIYKLAEKIKKEGYLEKCRKMAGKSIENIKEDILKLPFKKEASEFYDYIYSLTLRIN